VTAIWTLIGLLVLAYVGGFLFGGHAIRGFGLPSSAEYVVLGFVLGPHVLAVLDRATVTGFDMITNVGVGWIALVIGSNYGFVGRKRVRISSMLAGWALALFTAGTIFCVSYGFALFMLPLGPADRFLLAGGLGAACSETTRHAVRWVMERHSARGPLSRLIAEVSDADDLVPILGMAIVFSMTAMEGAPVPLPAWGWTVATWGLGIVTGLMATALLGKDFRLEESWGVLLGTSLLTIGLSTQVGFSPLTTMFAMGATIALVSRHRVEVVAMTEPTERAVLLPLLVLAGARLDLTSTPALPWIVAMVIVARLLSKVAGGMVLRRLAGGGTGGPLLGLGMSSTGGLAMSIGIAFALRFPGVVGDTVLAAASIVTVFGEFVGPVSLRNVLRSAGEIEVSPQPPPVAPIASEPSEEA
jgi:Kef-type K+ transport system membrane component KefB